MGPGTSWQWRVLFCMVFCWNLCSTTTDYDLLDSEELLPTTTSEPLPYFDDHQNLTNITAPLGSTAFLHCKVNLLKDKTVSWMKRDGTDVHLLTFGLHTYSGDERLSINFEQPNNWKLRIQAAERHDQGEYQCQVSSHPPIILHVSLTILVPRISIVDDLGKPITDKFYNAGSTLELRCIISHFHFPDGYSILWKQGNKTLNYDASRGGISVKTTVHKKEGATSVLYIANAKKNDSGPYICSLGSATTQLTQNMIYVHVINGDVPAAMQHSGTAPSALSFSYVVIISLFVMVSNVPSFSSTISSTLSSLGSREQKLPRH